MTVITKITFQLKRDTFIHILTRNNNTYEAHLFKSSQRFHNNSLSKIYRLSRNHTKRGQKRLKRINKLSVLLSLYNYICVKSFYNDNNNEMTQGK